MKIYIYPPRVNPERDIVDNPYINNLVNGFDSEEIRVVNKNSYARISILDLCKYIFVVDVVIFNWIENIENRKFGKLQFFLFRIAFLVLQLRRVKVVWVMHNIHPHSGETFFSSFVKKKMFKSASLIITHSREAEKYALKRIQNKNKVIFAHHPIKKIEIKKKGILETKEYDFLIWGSIEPYKGILEFLTFLYDKDCSNKFVIKIIGKCKNSNYENSINEYLNQNISFENRMVSFDELSIYIQKSKYVLFPYLSSSVSSSGALMDSLYCGANIIGPNKGAFGDLAQDGLCIVYNNYNDVFSIMESKKVVPDDNLKKFVSNNTWDKFCQVIGSSLIKFL